MGTSPITCVITPMLIDWVWYVAASGKVVNFRAILTICRCQLWDVARGLTYLHQYNVVHGNLTGVGDGFSPRARETDTFIA